MRRQSLLSAAAARSLTPGTRSLEHLLASAEYIQQTGAEPLVERLRPTQLSWIVGKTHTRGRGDGAPW